MRQKLLENRFIPRTTTAWSKGQFRWGFTISRDFDLLWKKKKQTKVALTVMNSWLRKRVPVFTGTLYLWDIDGRIQKTEGN